MGYFRNLSKHKKYGPLLFRYFYGFYLFLITCIGYIPSQIVRHSFYRVLGLRIGKGSTIHSICEIRAPGKISIGNNSIIGSRSILDGRGYIEIGNNVNLSTGVWIWTAQHDKNDLKFTGSIGNQYFMGK